MRTSVETIDPKQAAKWLESTKSNDLQRPLRQGHVDWLARQMTGGTWRLNGEAIILNGDQVMDGQHRLWACVLANVPFRSVVVRGVDGDAFSTIDTGVMRTSADALVVVLHGWNLKPPMSHLRALASAAKIYLAIDDTGRINADTWRAQTNAAVVAFIEGHRAFVDGAFDMCSWGRWPLPAGQVVALRWVTEPKFDDSLDSFFRPLQSGVALKASSPILALRNKASLSPRPADFVNWRNQFACLVKTWNYWTRGVDVRILRHVPGRDAFPSIIMAPGAAEKKRWRPIRKTA